MDAILLIGVCGGSGSGKTSFIKALKAKFQDQDLCLISQDDYYKPREDQIVDENGITNFDLPECIDIEKFVADIAALQNGEEVTKEEYVFNNPNVTPKILTYKPSPIIIVEGLFILHFRKIFNMLDVKIFLEAKDNLKVIRRIRRDRVERNYPLDDVLYRYEHHVLPAFEKFLYPYVSEVDVIVNNNKNFNIGLEIISGYIKGKLDESRAVKENLK